MKRTFFYSLYFNHIVYYIGGAAACLYVLSYFFPALFNIATATLILLGSIILLDTILLYARRNAFTAKRITAERHSNGDINKVQIEIQNNYSFNAKVELIDELPSQYQARKWRRNFVADKEQKTSIFYTLRPTQRGQYHFGDIISFISTPLGFLRRKFSSPASQLIKVYPSFFQLRRYHLLAVSNQLQQAGIKTVRKLGHSMEFEQIKEYVRGDDYRTINWKATARKGDLMVNNFTDERSQQVYCIINKGRVMKMPFNGLTLLDYSINSALVLMNVAIGRQDTAGLITFAETVDTFLPADKKPTQISLLLETLYRQETHFLEPDLEKLFSQIRNRITQRSLLVMYTNFESLESLERQLPFLKRIARYHLLLIVIFENTELKDLINGKASTVEDIYIKTIAEKFAFEKRIMVRELQKNGIPAILTAPENLTVNMVNKYVEMKNRQSI